MTWDNGDRTVLVNPDLGGVTLGWNLAHTAQDELFAAIEGTAFHTRIILERMAEHGVPVATHHQRRRHPAATTPCSIRSTPTSSASPILVPTGDTTSLGSAIFAFLAAGTFPTVDEAQQSICLSYRTYTPSPAAVAVYNQLYPLYRKAYFALGQPNAEAAPLGMLLPELRRIAALARC